MLPNATPSPPPATGQALAVFLQEHFVSRLRHDVKALYFPPAASGGKGGYRPDKAPVSLLDLTRHLTGAQPLGLYTMAPAHDGLVRGAVVDLDDKARDLTWTALCGEGGRVAAALAAQGLLAWPCVSGSGHGLHLWLLWDAWQAAGAVRTALCRAVDQADVSCHVDIFPAQARLNGGMGNLVALPLARASRPVDLATGEIAADLDRWQPVSPALSRGVAASAGPVGVDELAADAGRGLRLVRDEDQQAFGPLDPAYLAEALAVLDAADYELWKRVSLAIKVAIANGQLSEAAGERAWDQWSRTAPAHYDEKNNRLQWTRHLKARPGGVTLGSIFHEAKVAGWRPTPAAEAIGAQQVAQQQEAAAELRGLGMAGRMTAAIVNDDHNDDLLVEEMAWLTGKGGPEIEQLNRKHFIAQDGGKVHLFREDMDEALNRRRLSRLGIFDFKIYYQNKQVQLLNPSNGRPMYKPLGEVWLNSPFRRQYRELVLRPEGAKPWQYNMWQGWAVEPSSAGAWDLLDHHIKVNICARDPVCYEYVLNWCALTIQRPEQPIGVALVLRGNRGNGKSSFIRAIGELFGPHFMQVTNTRSITGNFNSHLRDCIMLFADEAVWAGSKPDESALKGLVTEPTITIEGKGRDSVVCRNMLHIAIATNHAWSVPAGFDERRFCCLNVGDEHQQDGTYFQAIQRQLQQGGSARLLHDLLQRDISKFNPQAVPSTNELLIQKLASMDPAKAWWYNCLFEGRLHDEAVGWEEQAPATLVYDSYIQACKDSGKGLYAGAPEFLSRSLDDLLPTPIKRRQKWCVIENRKQQRIHWTFPPLEACRQMFEKLVRNKILWPLDGGSDPELKAKEALIRAEGDELSF